ncbi:hypothetical protein [Qaidamihabitans albus]|uniref:hypothetical protein n=1 Tax=Qaidamihabitans albus TaxID=2795733 RepID=UPI0018F197A6|nr:hypothetical protein [Qaidamihabitans albus]
MASNDTASGNDTETDPETETRTTDEGGTPDAPEAQDTEHADDTQATQNTQNTEASENAENTEHTEGTTEAADGPGTAAVPARTPPARGFLAGGAAIVSAGLGLSSLTGTALGDMLHSRMEIIGQIEASTGAGGDQVEAFYGAPWHTAALINGAFALVAVLIGGVLLAAHARRPDTAPWAKAVALGGVLLGAIGLLVAGGMYLDIFASAPELPTMGVPGAGG